MHKIISVDLSSIGLGTQEISEDHPIFHHLQLKYFSKVLEYSAITMMPLCNNAGKEVDVAKAWFPGQHAMAQSIEELMKCIYVSCWYYSDNLSEYIANDFSKPEGVILRSTVGKWHECLKNSPSDDGEPSYYTGMVAYINERKELPTLTKFHNESTLDVIHASFIKPNGVADQKEFRTLFLGKTPSHYDSTMPKALHRVPVRLNTLCDSIYLPSDVCVCDMVITLLKCYDFNVEFSEKSNLKEFVRFKFV